MPGRKPPSPTSRLEPSGARGGLGWRAHAPEQLEAAIHHDRTSRLATLYERHAPGAGRLAYLLTGDADLAEDLAQEAFARLIARLGSLRDEAVIASYLRRSIVNLVHKHWRKARSERSYLRREQLNLAGQATMLPDVAEQDQLWRALQQLPHRQRAAIVLRFYEDLSEAETARVLGCAVGTVKSSVARGLRRLKEEMIGDEGVRA
jgi:RNA polymerase sigma-70 factor (sigma-E family)